jgi:hypothetical protein
VPILPNGRTLRTHRGGSLGDLAEASGDRTAARTAYTDPTNTEWQRDLAVALERLANLD